MSDSSLVRHWTLALVIGELVGFVPPALTGAALASAGASDPVLVTGLVLAGLLEGAAIGVAGAMVLRVHCPAVDGRAWVAGTVLGAGVAWLAGMGGSAVLGAGASPWWLLLLVPGWLLGLFAMGLAQWLVLRRVVPDSSLWVWVSAAAWLVGVLLPVTALSVVPNDWPAAAHVVVGVVAAVAMGATVGLLTGRTLARLLRGRPSADSHQVHDEDQRVASGDRGGR